MKFMLPEGFVSLQHRDELEAFVDVLRLENVQRYLEVGTCNGGTFYRVLRGVPTARCGVAVDLPGAAWGKRNSQRSLLNVIARLKRARIDASVIWGDSKSAEVQKAAAARAPFDAVFIDGDHTYDGVRSDWLAFGPLARIVAFHDIAAVGPRLEVPRFWAELKATHRHVEIIGKEPGMGIGILWRE